MQTHNLCKKLKASCLALALAFIVPQAFAQEVVEGFEIDGDIRFSDHVGASWDWASMLPDEDTGCAIDEDFLELTDCVGFPFGDWRLVQDPTSAGGATDPNIHEGGDKLGDPATWMIIDGNVPAKDDLGNIYAAKLVAGGFGVASAGETMLFNGMEREVNNGDSYFDFEYNAKIISPDGMGGYIECFDGINFLTGEPGGDDVALDGELTEAECPEPGPGGADGLPGRSPGDFVLSYKLGTANGNPPTISDVQIILLEADANGDLDFANPLVSILIEDDSMPIDTADLGNGADLSGLIPTGLGNPCDDLETGAIETCPEQTLVVALNNQVIDAGPWGTFQKNANKIGANMVDLGNFAEVAWNLDNIGKGPSCPGTAYMTNKSKASSSDTADLKDTARPVPFDLTNCGQITVIKQTNPDGGTGFDFELTSALLASTASASLDDNQFHPFTLLEPGDYNLAELDPGTWQLTDIDCVNDDASAAVPSIWTEDVPNRDVDITLVANGSVTCTFLNERPEVTLSKAVNSCGTDPGVFDLKINGTTVDSDGDGASGSAFVAIGPVALSEQMNDNVTSVSLNDYITQFGGSDCTAGNLTDGTTRTGSTTTTSGNDNKSCTFLNIRRAQVTLIKEFTDPADTGSFFLQVNGVSQGDPIVASDSLADRTRTVQLTQLAFESDDSFDAPTVGEIGNGTDLADYTTIIDCDPVPAATEGEYQVFEAGASDAERSIDLPGAIPAGFDLTCVIRNIPREGGATACLNPTL